tara:strand:- start:459 stop:1004 length:546 start_codon:yes stop_codon:yes gene_type:complete
MWPDTEKKLEVLISSMRSKAAQYNRTIQFGLRVHVIVRETENEAKSYANKLISKLDIKMGKDIKNRALDSKSLGVSKQASLREKADQEYYAEPHLWTGIGLARSGCGAAIVGNPEQVYHKIKSYMDMGINAFILSGYPHKKECELFAKYVLPKLKNIHLPEILGRVPKTTPNTPLGNGLRE